MEDGLLLLCTFATSTFVIKLSPSVTYEMLVNDICSRWINLSNIPFSLFYKLPGYDRCHLENDADMRNMVCIAKSFGVDRVDVAVDIEDHVDNQVVQPINSFTNDVSNKQVMFSNGDETDLLHKFCPHDDKVLMSASWANGITHVGQVFEGGAPEFRTVLAKFTVECGFNFKYIKNDSSRVTAECMLSETTGCEWSIHARAQMPNGFFILKRWNNLHTCGVAVRTSKHPRMNSELVSFVVVDRMRDKPLTRPSDVVYDLKKDYGVDVSYRVAWLGVEKAKGEVFGDHSCSFDQLRWYKDAVMQHNPGSYVNLDYDLATCRFNRFFISFAACITGFNHCRPLLFLDDTFLKGRFKGHMLAATAKDGNQGLFPLAFAIVDAENTTNWDWFLQQLSNIVDGNRTITFVSDRNAGLLEAMPKVFPTSHHAFCLQHLQANLRDRLKGLDNGLRDYLLRKLRESAYAPTVASFEHKLDKFKKAGRNRVQGFLNELPPQHWANAFFRGQRYGEMWSNAAESFNSWIRKARHLPITRLVDMIRTQIMRQMSNRRERSKIWSSFICPKMEEQLAIKFNIGRSWIVSQASEHVYEVHSFPSVSVDIHRCTCSCYQWQVNGVPCAHAVVAIQKSGKDLNAHIDPHFHVQQYRAAYLDPIFSIPTVEKPAFNSDDYRILPPVVRRPSGRLKKKRITSRGEKLNQIRCSRCGQLGNHNKKTCKKPI